MDLTDLATIRSLLDRHGVRFSRSMGQNFLCDASVPARIAAAAELDRETGVLEIGPGLGCLTAELSRRARRVVSVELDETLRPVLAETLDEFDNVELLFADALKLDLDALAERSFSDCRRAVVCAKIGRNILKQLELRAISTFDVSVPVNEALEKIVSYYYKLNC